MGDRRPETLPVSDTAKPGRLPYLDFLRAALMVIGIPYHAALAFSGRDWGVTSPVGLPALGYFADFTHLWRMPTFFVIAGLFAGLLVARRGPWVWFRGRLKRLGIPLLFGLIVIGPLQLLVLASINRERGQTILSAWIDETRSLGTWVGHLWFLVDLLIYCALFAALVKTGLWERVQARIARWVSSVRASAWKTFAVAVGASLLVAVAVAGWRFAKISLLTRGVVDVQFVTYAAFFVGGIILSLTPAMFTQAQPLRRPTLAIGAVSVAAATATSHALHAAGTTAALMAGTALDTLAGWYAAGILFAAAIRIVRGPNRFVTWLVDASLTIYVFHHPLMLLISHELIARGVAPIVGFFAACAAVFALSAIIYELMSRTAFTRWISTGSGQRTSSLLMISRRPTPTNRPTGR